MADIQGVLARIKQEMAEAMEAVKARYEAYMAEAEADYQRRLESGERFLDDPWTEESWRKHIGAPPMEEFAPAEIEKEPQTHTRHFRAMDLPEPIEHTPRELTPKMRMDGMGAGPIKRREPEENEAE